MERALDFLELKRNLRLGWHCGINVWRVIILEMLIFQLSLLAHILNYYHMSSLLEKRRKTIERNYTESRVLPACDDPVG